MLVQKKELALINHVETNMDTLIDMKESIKYDIKIKSLGRLVKLSEEKVNIELNIQEISERIISDIPVIVINIPDNIRIEKIL